MGKRAPGAPKTFVLTLRLSPGEHEAINELARAARCSRSEYARRMIREHAARESVPVADPAAIADAVVAALRQLPLPWPEK